MKKQEHKKDEILKKADLPKLSEMDKRKIQLEMIKQSRNNKGNK